jgi:hypothetical protein
MKHKKILIITAFVAAVAILSGIFWVITPSHNETAAPATVYNVKNYGAYGDGIHNDEAAILKAVSAAQGKVVYFPHGNYLVSKTFVLPVGTVARGEGDQYSTASSLKQSYLLVLTKNPDGTSSWGFKWLRP